MVTSDEKMLSSKEVIHSGANVLRFLIDAATPATTTLRAFLNVDLAVQLTCSASATPALTSVLSSGATSRLPSLAVVVREQQER